MSDRKKYLKKYRLEHKEKYREYQRKYRGTHLSTYEKLQQENQKYKEVIDKAIKRLEKDYKFANYDIPLLTKDEQLAGKLLEILKEVE